jgi:HAD superfamily hydrolase (TIGR01509 family)
MGLARYAGPSNHCLATLYRVPYPLVRRSDVNSRRTHSDAPNYSAILWDNDGVLVDTERLFFQATQEVFAGVGIDLTVQHYFEYFLMRSKGTSKFAAAHGLSEADIASMQGVRNERYLQLLENEPITISGVREALMTLRPHFVMGIVTSSRRRHFETMHRRTGLLELFDFAVTLEDYARSKPAPDPYLAGVARSGFPAGRCLAIEDAPRGLIAARAAALDCWVIPTELTRPATFSGATRVLDRIADVAALLLDANSAA